MLIKTNLIDYREKGLKLRRYQYNYSKKVKDNFYIVICHFDFLSLLFYF
jgi:hypothetical protein